MIINIKHFYEVYRFLFIGILAVIIDAIVYFFLTFNFNISHELSKRISFICGAIFAFYFNRNFVFKVKNKKINQYFMFSILYLISFLLNSLTHDIILHNTNIIYMAFLTATTVSTIINFLGQKFIVFKNKTI